MHGNLQNSKRQRVAFTLIELLVTMVIILTLMALLLPAVNRVREAGRRTSCANNLHQIGLANANYENQFGVYPPSWKYTKPTTSGTVDGWSAFGQLLPHLEQGNLYKNINFDISYEQAGTVTTADGVSTQITSLRVPTYICPSEPRDEAKVEDGVAVHYPLNYAVNLGTWLVFDPASGQGGNGAFFPGSRLKAANYVDGLSQTIAVAEVRAWQPSLRNTAKVGSIAIPGSAAAVVALGGAFEVASGHTEWVDGRAAQSGFTATFPPNANVAYLDLSGTNYDVDWDNWAEGSALNAPIYAAITARSQHIGMVNVCMMDGSVRAFSNDIHLGVWRALCTRAGGEIIPSKYNQ